MEFILQGDFTKALQKYFQTHTTHNHSIDILKLIFIVQRSFPCKSQRAHFPTREPQDIPWSDLVHIPFRPDLSGTESATLNRESSDSELCDSNRAILRLPIFCDSTLLWFNSCFCFSLWNFWRFRARRSENPKNLLRLFLVP